MALENLETAFNNLSLNKAKQAVNEVKRNISIDNAVKESENLLLGRGVTNFTVTDLANPFLTNIEYSARAQVGLSFKNLGDNPPDALDKAVDEILDKISPIDKSSSNPLTNFATTEVNRAINSAKTRVLQELNEAVQIPLVGRPTPFIDLSTGPGETNYLDYVSLQPVTSEFVDDEIAPEKRGDFYVRIKDLRNGAAGNVLYFRGYVTGITENVTPSWTPINYIGRSESVYMYERAERDVSFNLKVYPANYAEQKNMYNKMEALTSLAYPEYFKIEHPFDYTQDQSRMKAPFTELYMAHIGSRAQGQFGFIKSLTYTVNDSGDWDALRTLPRYFDIAISYQILSKRPPDMRSKFYNLGKKEKKDDSRSIPNQDFDRRGGYGTQHHRSLSRPLVNQQSTNNTYTNVRTNRIASRFRRSN